MKFYQTILSRLSRKSPWIIGSISDLSLCCGIANAKRERYVYARDTRILRRGVV
jgi:hypothetical protein